MTTDIVAEPLYRFSKNERLDYERTLLRLLIAGQISNLLDREDLMTKDLAARMGKRRSWVSKLLGGKRDWTLNTLAEVALALGVRWEIQTSRAPVIEPEVPTVEGA